MKRFFSDDSFWNQPIGNRPALDPDNGRFLAMLNGEWGGSFWINCNEYAIPVYEVDARTPRHTVHQEGYDMARHGGGRWAPRQKSWSQGPGFGSEVPIPDNARGNVVCTEGLYGHPGWTWDGILAPDELTQIPLNAYRVLKLVPITHQGDNRAPGQH